LLDEAALTKIEKAVEELTGEHMTRGKPGWELQIAKALETGLYAKRYADFMQGLNEKTFEVGARDVQVHSDATARDKQDHEHDSRPADT